MVDSRALPNELEARLDLVASRDPELHALISLDPSAPSRARELHEQRNRPGGTGPLHGVVIAVKDNIDVAGCVTSAGSSALSENLAIEDAPAVAALRRAGALVLGKANLSEWAGFRSRRTTSGWSATGGLVANPFALDRSAGGSSSGSAASVAAGYVTGAIGTETDGSIIIPSALCGCVGLKPTHGSIDLTGVVPLAPSQDVVGPIAASVQMAAQLFDAMSGASTESELGEGVTGMTVGVARSIGWGLRDELDASCELALRMWSRAGCRIVDPLALAAPGELDRDEFDLMLAEFKDALPAYLATHPRAWVRDLDELIAHNRADPVELAHFDQEVLQLAAESEGTATERYARTAARARREARSALDAAFQRGAIDAIAVPSALPAWKSDLVNGDPIRLFSASRLPAVSGYPAITVPVALVGELPVGICLYGPHGSEAALLRLAFALESARGPLPSAGFSPPSIG